MLPQMLGYIQTKPYTRMCSEKNCRKISELLYFISKVISKLLMKNFIPEIS